MSAEIEFGVLPPPGTRAGGKRGPTRETRELLERLQANTGQWAKVQCRDDVAARARSAYLKKTTGVDATTRGADLWVRWPEGKDA